LIGDREAFRIIVERSGQQVSVEDVNRVCEPKRVSHLASIPA
jgi:hypothetical protein